MEDINQRPSIEEFGLSFLEAYCFDDSGIVTNFAKASGLIEYDSNQSNLIKDYLAFKHKFVKERDYKVGENDATFRYMEDCHTRTQLKRSSENDKEGLKNLKNCKKWYRRLYN